MLRLSFLVCTTDTPLFFLCTYFFFNDPATTEIYTFPYTTLFRSAGVPGEPRRVGRASGHFSVLPPALTTASITHADDRRTGRRSEEHTSELQSLTNLVCRLLLEKKKKKQTIP